ncbi:MAG: hypothetical protein ACK4Z4_18440, partial [Ferrovibrio sp.]
ASRTCGEHSIEDVCAEAWLLADEISRKRGWSIDFRNADDQNLILSWLHGRLVRYAEKTIRYAVKLDRDWDSEDPDSAIETLARLLTAPEQFDPLVRLLDEEEKFDPLALIRHSYSQASAYVILLHRADWDLETLAQQLHLVVVTIKARVMNSAAHMKRQPSLFDRINAVTLDFAPSSGRSCQRAPAFASHQIQMEWDFSPPA